MFLSKNAHTDSVFQGAESFSFICTDSANNLTGTSIAIRESCTTVVPNDGVNLNLVCPIVIPSNLSCPFLAFNSLAADITLVSLMYFGAGARPPRACMFL